MRIARNLVLPLAALIVIVAGASTANAQYGANWRIDVDAAGRVTSMATTDPITPLGIEHEMTLQTGPDGVPSGGTVVFKDGARRTMDQLEARTYWMALGGQKAVWNRWEADGKLSMINPKSIPNDAFDRETHVITTTGIDVYGILSATSNTGQFALRNDGIFDSSDGPVSFTVDSVRQIEQFTGAPAVSSVVK